MRYSPRIKWSMETFVEQVRNECNVDPSTECWNWTRARLANGYGRVTIDGKQWSVHRLVLFVTTGVFDEMARHSCDNPPCCNPEHLSWGTALDNMADCVERGRWHGGPPKRGEASHFSKLTEPQIVEIRRRRSDGETATSLASEYGVTAGQIRKIVSRQQWSHLPDQSEVAA